MRPSYAFFILGAGAAGLSCREPTQVTLELSTNAACAAEPLAPLMLLETGIVAGAPERVARPDAAANTTTSACNAGEIGTVVLYPEDGALDAAALVIGRLHDDADPGSIERCIQFANPDPNRDPALPPVDGSNCILARRRVAFIEHVPLRLPIRLDVACAGVLCAADETCVADELGVRCASATVSCDQSGSCDDPAGTGGAGTGGEGGKGAGGEDGLLVTQLSTTQTFEHVAGVDETGEVFALDIRPDVGTDLYRVEGDAIEPWFADTEPPPSAASNAMHVRSSDGAHVIGWDNDGIVKIFSAGRAPPLSIPFPALEAYPDGPASAVFLRQGSYDVARFDGAYTQICAPSGNGFAATSLARAGGATTFLAGPQLCDCTACTPSTVGTFVDIAGHPGAPVAVAVAASHVVSVGAQGQQIQLVTLIQQPMDGQLGRVHVTPSGAVWVAAATPTAAGGTLLARGVVDASGAFDATWVRGRAKGVEGVKSLWATDGPPAAAYLVANDGKLFRITNQ